MLRFVDHNKMGTSHQGWLNSIFHFSFAEYFNPQNIQFGALRVINDDLVEQGTGFGRHPHKDMEIISYVVDGHLTHADSMGNEHTLKRGDVQYMSAGTGVFHSEYNNGDSRLRFLQIWILPNARDYRPNYGDLRLAWEDRKGKWLHIVQGDESEKNAPIIIHQDANIYVSAVEENENINFEVGPGRQAYLVQIEGQSEINGIKMQTRDALEITEENIEINPSQDSHFLIVEMAKA